MAAPLKTELQSQLQHALSAEKNASRALHALQVPDALREGFQKASEKDTQFKQEYAMS